MAASSSSPTMATSTTAIIKADFVPKVEKMVSTEVPALAATIGRVVADQPRSLNNSMAALMIDCRVSAACLARKGEW